MLDYGHQQVLLASFAISTLSYTHNPTTSHPRLFFPFCVAMLYLCADIL
jgi:hypothetical protein